VADISVGTKGQAGRKSPGTNKEIENQKKIGSSYGYNSPRTGKKNRIARLAGRGANRPKDGGRLKTVKQKGSVPGRQNSY